MNKDKLHFILFVGLFEVVPRLVENEEAVLPSRMLIWECTFLRTERRTAMRKKYQKFQTKSNEEVELPEGVSMDDLIDGLREDIEAMGATHGLLIMHHVMEGQLTRIAGEKGKHMPDRMAIRGGTQPGYVIYGGQKVGVMHPRVRKVNGEEIPLPAYQRFQSDGRMQREVTKKVLAGVSSRNYSQVVEDVMNGYGIKKSSVDRHMVAATAKQLANLLNRPLGGMNICALMIDGKEVAGERLMVALGVDFRGEKHVLGLWQGTTENSEVCGALIDNLIDRGLDPNQGYLAVIDGAKGIKKAIETKLGDKTLIQRCQFHKRRNVLEHLPEAHQSDVSKRILSAYKMTDYTDAKSALMDTIRHLEGLNPSAARSLEEGLEETLTLHRLCVPSVLRQSLRSTNLIESCLSVVEEFTRRVKRWRGGTHRQRWVATGLIKAEKKFRRVRGHTAMPFLTNALRVQVDVVDEAA